MCRAGNRTPTVSLTVDQLRELARATVSPDAGARAVALAALGDPAPDALAASAVAFVDHADRNVRVAALRVLGHAEGGQAVAGVLRGLDDPVKRVREVAAKSSARFLTEPRVVDRLKLAVERDETGSRGPALMMLAGVYSSPYGLTALAPVTDAVRWLRDLPKYREFALTALLRTRVLSDDVAELLRDTVKNGSKDEAVAATRRLCGFRVAHRGELDAEARRRSDRAWGDVYYWVRVPDEQ
jgi:HEAT repeat protein